MTEQALATFRIDKQQWEALKDKAKSNGINATSLFLSWVQAYLNGNLDSGIDGIDNSIDGIDNRIDKAVLPLVKRLDKLEEELGKFGA
jgi:hypothetical protein